MPSRADYEAEGLLDLGEPDVADRVALLDWLSEQGVGLDEMSEARSAEDLVLMAAERLMRPGRRFGADEVRTRTGLEAEELDALRRAAGFPSADGPPMYTDADVALFETFSSLPDIFSEQELLHFVRVLSASLGRVADAAVSLFLVDVEAALLDAGESELEFARKNLEAIAMLEQATPTFDTLLRLQMQLASARSRGTRAAGDATMRLAIGFVDLAGFTPLSEQTTVEDLGGIVREFEQRAYDVVADHGGRVVKLIGDEVMFVAVDAGTACAAGLALVEAFDEIERVTPRGGLAYGGLVPRGGDYYGPVVNVASRIGDLAVPGELLVTPELADAARGYRFTAAGRRMLRGVAEPVTLLSLDGPLEVPADRPQVSERC